MCSRNVSGYVQQALGRLYGIMSFSARSDQFAEAVERGRYILPTSVWHRHRRYDGIGRVLLQNQRRGQTSQGLHRQRRRGLKKLGGKKLQFFYGQLQISHRGDYGCPQRSIFRTKFFGGNFFLSEIFRHANI